MSSRHCHDCPPRPLIQNPVIAKLAAGAVVLGLIVRLSKSGEIARIARASGHDFLYIDAQHSLFNLESIGHIIQTALACEVAPFVRVTGVQDPSISLFLDAGALGIVVPNVETADQARRAVEATKFPPVGRRSFGGPAPHLDYVASPPAELAAACNAAVLLLCMIETPEGLANVESIASTEGVDGLYLGAADMLLSMGADSAELPAALAALAETSVRHGLVLGCGGLADASAQIDAIRQGVNFLTTDVDSKFVMTGAVAAVRTLRTAEAHRG